MNKAPLHSCVGIDGCKNGWIAVSSPVSSLNKSKACYYKNLWELKRDFCNKSVVIIDMPIGLEVDRPNRLCDVEARKFLGTRSSTIFSPPCQAAIIAKSYEEAKDVNLKKTGKSISKQSWFISKKILETKNFVENQNEISLNEGHPECSFAEYAGSPIQENKKSPRGVLKRLKILTELRFNLPELAEMLSTKVEFCVDDLFDAAILCWTANRVYHQENRTFPVDQCINRKKTFNATIKI